LRIAVSSPYENKRGGVLAGLVNKTAHASLVYPSWNIRQNCRHSHVYCYT